MQKGCGDNVHKQAYVAEGSHASSRSGGKYLKSVTKSQMSPSPHHTGQGTVPRAWEGQSLIPAPQLGAGKYRGAVGPGWGTKLSSCFTPQVIPTRTLLAPYKSYSKGEGTAISQQLLSKCQGKYKGTLSPNFSFPGPELRSRAVRQPV